jgi:hypothetical protein
MPQRGRYATEGEVCHRGGGMPQRGRYATEGVFPQPQSLPLRPFQIFFASQGAPPVSTILVANLPLVSTTLAANFSTSFASVVDTGGKFATGINDTCGNQWEQLSKSKVYNLK